MIPNHETIQRLRSELRERGATVLIDPNGKRLVLMRGGIAGLDGQVVIAYEGWGTAIFDGDRALNEFRLISSGFSMKVARTVADLVNAVVGISVPPAVSGAKAQVERKLINRGVAAQE